jgi:hypothetical protein
MAEDINAKIRGTFWKLEDANNVAAGMREKVRGVSNRDVMGDGKYKEDRGRDGGGIWYYDGEEMRWYSRKKNGFMMDVEVWSCAVQDSADAEIWLEKGFGSIAQTSEFLRHHNQWS